MAKHIVVLSDGTWEETGGAVVMAITDEAFEQLEYGEINADQFRPEDVLSETVIGRCTVISP